MTDHIEVQETEEQKETRIRLAKARRALLVASEVAFEMAGKVYPTTGETEAGESVRVARIPMRGHALDDLNDLYGTMVEAVIELHDVTGEGLPMGAAAAVWQSRQEVDEETGEAFVNDSVYGLPWRFGPGGARDLTSSLALWMNSRMEHLLAMPGGVEIVDGLMRTVWTLRHRYKLETPSARTVSPRPCPICGDDVEVLYFSRRLGSVEAEGQLVVPSNAEERRDPKSPAGRLVLDLLDGIDAHCSICDWKPPARPDQLVRWMEGDRKSASKMRDRPHRDLSDPNDTWWTVDEAAAHFNVTPKTIRLWVQEKLVTKYKSGVMAREELLAAFREKCSARANTRMRPAI